MFDIGWSEFVVIGVVALIAIGPKELPTVLRTAGQWVGKIRRMAAEFQGQLQEAMREAEMADLKKHIDDIHDTVKGFDPVNTVRRQIEAAADSQPTEPAAEVTVPGALSTGEEAERTAMPAAEIPAIGDASVAGEVAPVVSTSGETEEGGRVAPEGKAGEGHPA